ncbi:hypothetical protein J6590_097471 [Homalodisca vitripennis]|nr:hypothetical protein J6590_097471 [Homalodisca vitripennis]
MALKCPKGLQTTPSKVNDENELQAGEGCLGGVAQREQNKFCYYLILFSLVLPRQSGGACLAGSGKMDKSCSVLN